MTIYKRGDIWYVYHWFKRDGQVKRVRISLGTKDYAAAVAKATTLKETLPDSDPRIYLPKPFKFTEAWISGRYHAIKHRSKKQGLPGLTRDEIRLIVARADGRCEVTGIAFSNRIDRNAKRAAYAPSIDRIDARLPYTLQNCRLVCFGVNVAMNQWGETFLRTVSVAMLSGEKFGKVGPIVRPQATRPA